MHARRGIFLYLPVTMQQIRRENYSARETYEFVDKQTEEILLLFWFISEESENQVDGLSADIGKGI